ncbi:MAG: gliding motility lipoprotein GldH [Flavobacteriales bacterium]
MRKIAFLFICAIGLIACTQKSEFEGNQPINHSGWGANEPVHFEFETHDTVKLHNFYIDVRNSEDYPFSNIFFFVEMEFPNGKKSIDTVECQLADDQGRWLGTASASLHDHEFLYQRGKQFPLGGRYKVDIRQGMRQSPLQGITDIGFKLTHTEP